jgi:hypothetical protein
MEKIEILKPSRPGLSAACSAAKGKTPRVDGAVAGSGDGDADGDGQKDVFRVILEQSRRGRDVGGEGMWSSVSEGLAQEALATGKAQKREEQKERNARKLDEWNNLLDKGRTKKVKVKLDEDAVDPTPKENPFQAAQNMNKADGRRELNGYFEAFRRDNDKKAGFQKGMKNGKRGAPRGAGNGKGHGNGHGRHMQKGNKYKKVETHKFGHG